MKTITYKLTNTSTHDKAMRLIADYYKDNSVATCNIQFFTKLDPQENTVDSFISLVVPETPTTPSGLAIDAIVKAMDLAESVIKLQDKKFKDDCDKHEEIRSRHIKENINTLRYK